MFGWLTRGQTPPIQPSQNPDPNASATSIHSADTSPSLLPPVPKLALNVEDDDEDNDSDDGASTPRPSTPIKTAVSSSSSSSATSATTTPSSSSLHPSSAHAFRAPQPPRPVTPELPADEASLNAFPMLNGPQRAGGGTGSGPNPIRKKVPLQPGHSPLDWAKLKNSNTDLRGVRQLTRYTLEELREHRTRDNVWMAIQGKVYNVTHYLKFHPGGAGQLMRGAGKDATQLFLTVHPWVNVDALLDKCMVGYLVKEKPIDAGDEGGGG
ncbi:hypothetical protein HK104_000536 [Borealophlyctis nickersoniae]|nr:hypothetical protein HK104_000536 [Borealophlyctis nickersoniae]